VWRAGRARHADAVSVIDTARHRVLKTLSAGHLPASVAVTPDRRLNSGLAGPIPRAVRHVLPGSPPGS
jgi:YVTN family beta-propeller protein